MYKDKDKQKEANKQAKQRQRAKKGMTSQQGMTDTIVIPKLHPSIMATIYRLTTKPDGTVDKQARTNRMAIALDYERKFPDRPYTGV